MTKRDKMEVKDKMKMDIRCEADHSINGREYLLLQLDLDHRSGFIAAVMDEDQWDMAVIGKDKVTVGESFERLAAGEISPMHLREAVDDIIKEKEYANI